MSRLSGLDQTRVSMGIYFRRGWIRIVAFALLWWVLTAGATDSWLVGVPVVLIAASISLSLVPPVSWSPVGIAYFVLFFIWHSLRGGVDVAWRAFHPGLPILPGLVDYPLRLPAGLPRVLMVNTVSLLPGTLSVELVANRLKVHVLDTRRSISSELETLEQVVARMFATSLYNAEGGKCDEEI